MLSFSADLSKIVDEYNYEVRQKMLEASKETAKDTVSLLRQTSPKGKGAKAGQYARGWKSKKQTNGYIVYNATDYQLTHLLEKGHRIFVRGKYIGRSTRPKVHIKPAEEQGNLEYLELVKEKLSK